MDEPRLATSAEITQAAATAKASGRLGIDTEFISEGRYRPLLCLVQVVVDAPGGSSVVLIDALAGDAPVQPVAALLADPSVEVVLHAGRQDVAILRRAWDTDVVTIFDTQISAGFAGQSAQSGYGNLIGAMLGRRLAKSASYTRWDARPLSAEQLHYAVEDVAQLLELADELKRRLRETGRLGWAVEECRRLESASEERDPETVWERLPRISQLDPRSRAVARTVAAWRERTASREDRPVGSVLADQVVVEVARRRPSTPNELARIRGVHRSVLNRRGDGIVAAVQRGMQEPPIPRERAQPRSEPVDVPVIALVEAWLRARALEAGLAYELVSSRAELEAVVGAARRGDPEPPVRALTGWREQLVGDELRNLVSGRNAIAVDGDLRLRLLRTPLV
ncbi:MAG TPA: HRDC domain-containing protein [Solirubrobacteraceae bacterium]|nr:HRDC domain-containing protein [Solirubrobacteraceae bacterium]